MHGWKMLSLNGRKSYRLIIEDKPVVSVVKSVYLLSVLVSNWDQDFVTNIKIL